MYKILDLCCCQGAASAGYQRAGFEVFGVDIDPQPRYPFPFHHGDALDVLRRLLGGDHILFPATPERRGRTVTGGAWLALADFDAIHASPPCQRYSITQRIQSNEHPDLIAPIRAAMIELGKPYVIENVMEARSELRDPVMLCGASFGLRTYRHRMFESNIQLRVPDHQEHKHRTIKMGRSVAVGDFYHAVGNFSGVEYIRRDLGVPWMSRDGIRECIPPAYAQHIGAQLLEAM